MKSQEQNGSACILAPVMERVEKTSSVTVYVWFYPVTANTHTHRPTHTDTHLHKVVYFILCMELKDKNCSAEHRKCHDVDHFTEMNPG